jgi:hypothetical protein
MKILMVIFGLSPLYMSSGSKCTNGTLVIFHEYIKIQAKIGIRVNSENCNYE